MIDPQQFKLFQQAYQIGQDIVDLVKNQKADAAVLGLLAGLAMLRRKASFSVEEVNERFTKIDAAVDLIMMTKGAKKR